MGSAQNWTRVIDAIETLDSKNLIFEVYFVGSGSKLEFLKLRLKKMIKKK